jgi:hypothetical protein
MEACNVKGSMLKALLFVTAALAIAATVAPAAAPKVTSIRLVSTGGFAAHHTETVVDGRNRAALARTAALVPATLPRLQPLESGCMDCILNTLTIVRGGRSSRFRWYNGAPPSLRRLLSVLAKNGRNSGKHA